MTRMKNLFIAFATLSTLFAFAPNAAGQGVNIITYDQARIMQETTGGKDISQKVSAIGNSMKTELESEGRALDTESKSLETRTANLTREALAADTNLRTQLEAFGRKRAAFQQKSQIRQAELQRTDQAAWGEFFKELQPAIAEVAAERNAQLVIERSQASFVSPNLDVTSILISKMNSRKPSFTVTRARIQAPAETIQ